MSRYFFIHVAATVALCFGAAAQNANAQLENGATDEATAADNQAVDQAVPVALSGYSPVTLVDGGRWSRGEQAIFADLDGRRYHFTSNQEKQSFLASPQRYVPVLGGDCVMTYATSGRRIAGNINFGALHKQRFYFFSTAEMKQQFLAEPLKYENVDLAMDGNCPVCRVDLGEQVAGKPEFAVYLGGLRYLFPTDLHRQSFLADPQKYLNPEPPPVEQQQTELPVAFKKYCPVCLKDDSKWMKGSEQFRAAFDGKVYFFPSESERDTFLANPTRYVPVLSGDCVVCLVDGGKRHAGSIFHATYYKDRLYLFPTADEKSQFKANPEKYAVADLAVQGNCPVSLVDSGVAVQGDEQFEYLYRGMRDRFRSAQEQKKFTDDPQSYVTALSKTQ